MGNYIHEEKKDVVRSDQTSYFNITDSFRPPPSSSNDDIISTPFEIIHEIFLFLETDDLFKVKLTCRLFHSVSNTQYFWKQKCRISYPHLEEKLTNTEKKEIQENRENCVNWKKMFYDEWFRRGDQDYRKKYKPIKIVKKGSTYPTIRILTMGTRIVGKSSLVLRFLDDRFDDKPRGEVVRIQRFGNTLTKKAVKLEICDFARESYFSRNYYRGCDGVVVLFSINDYRSFELSQYWTGQVLERVKDRRKVCVYLIGAKCDLKRRVAREEAEGFAKEKKLDGYFETSAKKNINVWMIFGRMLDKIIQFK